MSHNNMKLGIILVDVSINGSYFIEDERGNMTTVKLQVRPFQGGYEDFNSRISMNDSTLLEKAPEGHSLFEDLLYYWGNTEHPGSAVDKPTLVSLSSYPLRVVAAEWMMYLEVMFHSTKLHEYPPGSIPAAFRQIALLTTDVSILQAWARRNMTTSSKIHDVIRFLEYQKDQNKNGNDCRLLIDDYQYIAARVDMYSRRSEVIISTITSLIQMFDSQQSLKETANIRRLTYLALVFIPLTFVSGLLSMNDSIASESKVFWLYLSIAIPVCTVVFFIARPPQKILDFFAMCMWRIGRQNDRISAKNGVSDFET